MSERIRRVVTGHDGSGTAVVVSDELATDILARPNRPGVTLTNLWQIDDVPAEYLGPTESLRGPFVLHPPNGGAMFRIVEFEPEDPAVLTTLDGKAAFAEMGAADDPSDRLCALEPQLGWLRDAGLEDVDCIWKWRSLALLRGTVRQH